MRLLWLLGCFLHPPAIQHEVSLAELAPLGASQLASLSDEEHALALAQTELAGAKTAVERARTQVGDSARGREEVRLQRDGDEATLKLAREVGEPGRVADAEAAVRRDQRRLDAADAEVDWRDAQERAARADEALAETNVDLKTAELEGARLELLREAGRGERYRRSEFDAQLKKAQERYDEALQDSERATEAANRAYREWTRLDRT